MSHPVPFMKASNVLAPKKTAKEAPDLEEAIEEEDDGQADAADAPDDDEFDLKNDKYVKQPKKKRATTTKAASKDNEDKPDGPKKGRGKATVKGKGKK